MFKIRNIYIYNIYGSIYTFCEHCRRSFVLTTPIYLYRISQRHSGSLKRIYNRPLSSVTYLESIIIINNTTNLTNYYYTK